MGKKQAIYTQNLKRAIAEDIPIVLMTPREEGRGLSDMFNQDISTQNAPMTSLDKFSHPKRGQYRYHARLETQDWPDFEQKLSQIREAGKLNALYIESHGVVTNFRNACYTRDTEANLTQSLTHEGHGDALYIADTLKIAFPRLSFNQSSGLSVVQPYMRGDDPALRYVTVYDSAQHALRAASNPDKHEEEPQQKPYIDHKMEAAGETPDPS